MANTILTALGLDITQFETAANKTDGFSRGMAHGFELVDSAIRKIPLAGRLYAGTIGRLIDETAEAVTQQREFARIMETDVTRSLNGAVTQIDDITNAIERMNKVSISRSIRDFFVYLKTRGHEDPAKNRDAGVVALQQKRTELIQKSVELVAQEENSRSALAAGSEVEAERTRLRLDYEEKILRATEEARKQGGPDRDKWETAITERLQQQKDIYKEIYDREREGIEVRFAARQEELKTSVKLAEIQFKGNERDIAAEELRLALRKQQLANQGGTGEEQAETSKSVKVSQSNLDLAKHNYELTVAQLGIETKLMDQRVHGQGRAATQTQIRAKYEIQIAEALRRGNTELAKQLAAQQQIEKLQEAIRQYELGGRGRAAERREERHRGRIARTVESRLRERALTQLPGEGLRSGGLISGGALARKAAPVLKPTVPPAQQKFMSDVVELLGNLKQ